ncbi:MAG: D-alanyl-D-alanine carboxypeptidase/D-alanyl-D-alanine-endopeptidase [Bacteroidaceae bacterium]|nr:D-alanyl-D-alanine carboxypeptidase/D-alanyl-D-alanine-endopeptidase [Bacteroidaceae bacterium]
MKNIRFLLLLLLVASCASRQTAIRHRNSHQADVRPVAPVTVQVQTPVVVEEEEEEEPEVVVSARPLVSQVYRFPGGTWQYAKQQALDSLCLSPIFETTQLGLYVYDLTDGQPLYAINAAHRMRPASCQKIVTAVTALHFLKGNYQFRTDFRITGNVKAGVLEGDLIVVGGMDPLVTADELLNAAATIKQKQGINSIAGNVVFDLSMREDKELGWGWCWDDDYGPLSALLVDGKACFEEEWLQALTTAGIKTPSGSPLKGENKASPSKGGWVGSSSVYTIRHSIDELLEPMMKESNNIYAECLFYQTAATTGKKWAGRKEAAGRTEELLKRIGLNPEQYRVADGSGLSLYNYVSAEMLVAILGYAWRTPAIKEHLLPSLPIASIDGTMEKRMQDTEAQGKVRAKTGTVTGVVSLAGYLTAANGHTLAFAIINQGVASSAIGRAFQDKVCIELCK